MITTTATVPRTTRRLDSARRAILLEHAEAEAHRRRARARAFTSLTFAAAALLVVLVASTFPTPRHSLLTEPPPGAATPPAGAAPVAPAPPAPAADPNAAPGAAVPPPGEQPAAAAPAAVQAPGATSPAPDCRASSDPACGPVEYVPAPQSDRPVSVTVQADRPGPYREGDQVHLTFTIDDPDAAVTSDCVRVTTHDPSMASGIPTCAASGSCPVQPARYGTWPPPQPTPGHLVVPYDVVMSGGTSSSLVVEILVRTGGPCPDPAADLYGSDLVRTYPYTWEPAGS